MASSTRRKPVTPEDLKELVAVEHGRPVLVELAHLGDEVLVEPRLAQLSGGGRASEKPASRAGVIPKSAKILDNSS